MKKIPVLLLFILLLAGCDYSLPAVDSGAFELHTRVAGKDTVTTGPLAVSQVKSLVEWLHSRQTGWKYRIEDTAPALMAHLRKNGNTVITVNVHEREIKAGDRFLAITPDEHAELVTILNPTGR